MRGRQKEAVDLKVTMAGKRRSISRPQKPKAKKAKLEDVKEEFPASLVTSSDGLWLPHRTFPQSVALLHALQLNAEPTFLSKGSFYMYDFDDFRLFLQKQALYYGRCIQEETTNHDDYRVRCKNGDCSFSLHSKQQTVDGIKVQYIQEQSIHTCTLQHHTDWEHLPTELNFLFAQHDDLANKFGVSLRIKSSHRTKSPTSTIDAPGEPTVTPSSTCSLKSKRRASSTTSSTSAMEQLAAVASTRTPVAISKKTPNKKAAPPPPFYSPLVSKRRATRLSSVSSTPPVVTAECSSSSSEEDASSSIACNKLRVHVNRTVLESVAGDCDDGIAYRECGPWVTAANMSLLSWPYKTSWTSKPSKYHLIQLYKELTESGDCIPVRIRDESNFEAAGAAMEEKFGVFKHLVCDAETMAELERERKRNSGAMLRFTEQEMQMRAKEEEEDRKQDARKMLERRDPAEKKALAERQAFVKKWIRFEKSKGSSPGRRGIHKDNATCACETCLICFEQSLATESDGQPVPEHDLMPRFRKIDVNRLEMAGDETLTDKRKLSAIVLSDVTKSLRFVTEYYKDEDEDVDEESNQGG